MNKKTKEAIFLNNIKQKYLYEICNIKRGERITKKDLVDDGKYVAISGENNSFGRINKFNREANTITIAQYGSAGYVNFQKEKFWANDVVCSIFPNTNIINNKFLYYCLLNKQKYIYTLTTKALPNHLPIEKLNNLLIPIPPLETQNEIVRILDKYIELEKELELRTKQYEYYKNLLLNNNSNKELTNYKIKDICEVKRGIVISKKYIQDNQGKYPVFSSQTIDNGVIGKINSYKFDGEYITWTTDGANAGTVFYRNGKFNITNVCGLLKIKDDKYISTKYLYYLLSITTWKHVNKNISNPKLMSNKMENIEISIPNLLRQQEVVNILNKFSSITEDIKTSIPREIELTKKQYLYWRNKLLNFKEE